MNIILRHDSEKPMYEQICDAVKEAIYNNELENNQMLPSVRQLAAQLNVSSITTKRAYIELEHAGLVYTISGKGTFVMLEDLDDLKNQRVMEMLEKLQGILEEAKDIGIEKEQLEAVISKVYGGGADE